MDPVEVKEEPEDRVPFDDSQYTFATDSENGEVLSALEMRGEASIFEDEVKVEEGAEGTHDTPGEIDFAPASELEPVAELEPAPAPEPEPEPTLALTPVRFNLDNVSIGGNTPPQQIIHTLQSSAARRQAEVARRAPISRHGERAAKAYEYFYWGRHVRMFFWVQVLRKTPPNLIRKFYEGVLSPAQCTTRVAQRLRDYAKELAKPESRIISAKKLDAAGAISSFMLYYIPGNQSKDIPFWIAQAKEPEYILVERDAAIKDATVNAIIDDLVLQGISARRIAELFAIPGFYQQLFGANGANGTDQPVPRPVLKHLKAIFRKQQQGYESLLEGCIDGLIEHAPTPEIGYALLEYANAHGMRSSGGRYLTAGVNWYKTWAMVWGSLSDSEQEGLRHVDSLV